MIDAPEATPLGTRAPYRAAPRSARRGPAAALRDLATPLGVLALVVGAFCLVAAVNPNQPGHYPECPIHRFTGLYCPGCGGLRSAYAVAHGEFGTAIGDNALAVAGYATFAVVWALWCVRVLRGGRSPGPPGLRARHGWAACVLVLAFCVVRNLPCGGALAP